MLFVFWIKILHTLLVKENRAEVTMIRNARIKRETKQTGDKTKWPINLINRLDKLTLQARSCVYSVKH